MADGIFLFSAGLDSTVGARLLVVQGVNIRLVTFLNPFVPDREAFEETVRRQAGQVGLEPDLVEMGDDYLDVIKSPARGYGKNLNPCIDCRIYQLKRGREMLAREGGRFLATGEVVGQRPMSQRRQALELIEREAGVDGMVVRPLCALLLEPSRAEQEGLVDRARLLDIKGRSRRRQMELAAELGIESYPSPAGGCLLTDRNFSGRVRDLMAHEGLSMEGIELLKVGRHFRPEEGCRIVVGRDQRENERLVKLAGADDLLVRPEGFTGPDCLVRGRDSEEIRRLACALVVRYSRYDKGTCLVQRVGHEEARLSAAGIDEETLDRIRIGSRTG